MGIRISPFNAAWSYTGFHEFRGRLAAEEGIALDTMAGFGGTAPWVDDAGNVITSLEPLLNHSDCEGYLDSYQCEQIAPRLEQILTKWASLGGYAPTCRYDLEQGLRLLLALRHSAEHGCAVAFS